MTGIRYYALALKMAEELQQPYAACSYKLSIGNAYLANEEIDTARTMFEEALAIAGQLDTPQAEISALTSLMQTHIVSGNNSMVELYGNHALRLARDAGVAESEIAIQSLLTAFLAEQAQYSKALPHLQRGLELAEANADWNWQLTMRERLGFAYYQLGRLEEAGTVYKEALGTAEQLQDPQAAAQLYGRLGAVLAEQEQIPEAIKAAERALQLAVEHEDNPLIGEQHILLAFAYAEQGDVAEATEHCREAIAMFQLMEDADRQAKAEALLKELQELVA